MRYFEKHPVLHWIVMAIFVYMGIASIVFEARHPMATRAVVLQHFDKVLLLQRVDDPRLQY
jgi:hypothetical protein